MRIASSTSVSAEKSKSAPKQFDQRAALFGMQRLEQVAEFRLVQVVDFALQRQRVAIGDRGADLGQERRQDDAVLAIDVGVGVVSGSGAARLFVFAFHQRLPPSQSRKRCQSGLDHDPEKGKPVFRKDHD